MLKKSILILSLCSGYTFCADKTSQNTPGWLETITTETQCALASAGSYFVAFKTGEYLSYVFLYDIGRSNPSHSLIKRIVVGLASSYVGGLIAQEIHDYIDSKHTHNMADNIGFVAASFVHHYPKLR